MPGALDKGVHQKQHPPGRQEGAREVEVPQPGDDPLGLQQGEGAGEHHERERDVDEERPAPARALGEDSADQDPGRARQSRDRPPDPEGEVAVALGAEGRGQRRQRRRREHGRAHSLDEARAHQQAGALSQAARQRRGGEHHQPGHQHPPPAEEVGRPGAQQEEAAEGEHVGADHPLQALLAEAEIALDRGQGDVEDRVVENVHELDEAEQEQDRDAAPRRQRRRCSCGVRSRGWSVECDAHRRISFRPDARRVVLTTNEHGGRGRASGGTGLSPFAVYVRCGGGDVPRRRTT